MYGHTCSRHDSLPSSACGFELLGSVAAEQEPRGISFEAVADAAQVADQGAQFAKGRAQLRQAVVGEAADRAAVLVEDLVGAARGRVTLGAGHVQAVAPPGSTRNDFALATGKRSGKETG